LSQLDYARQLQQGFAQPFQQHQQGIGY